MLCNASAPLWCFVRVRLCMCACVHLKLFCTIRPDAGQNEHGPPVMALAKLKQHTQDIRTRDTHWQMLSHTHTQMNTHPPADPITQRCATRWKQIYPENQLI